MADTEKDQGKETGSGRGWHGDPTGHAEAGRKGGETISQNRDHMAEIGRKGGQTVSRDRRHMAEIGRKGGQTRGQKSGGAHSKKENEDEGNNSSPPAAE